MVRNITHTYYVWEMFLTIDVHERECSFKTWETSAGVRD